ncbi:MAG TPA: hypothetical protein VFQ22_13855 [Longimicrobiales bacterium]|nr:hypothetical protein [Longimicrobiales bacterium]
MRKPSRWEREASAAGREATRRAIRRLDLLEWIGMGAAAAVAVFGGALVAAVLVGRASPAFRTVWMVTSLSVFIIGGVIVAIGRWREARARAARREAASREPRTDEDG